jgi:threonine dehydrogenase-like Zn-dependent dehydrogenase
MSETMRVAAITDVRKVELVEVPRQQAKPDGLLVRIRAVALCTWEQRTYSGVDTYTRKPFVGGHEYAGEVVEIGPEAETDLEVGDLVAVGPGSGGRHDRRTGVETYEGLWGPFGLAEYRAIPVDRAYRVAPDLPLDHACFAEPIACVVRGITKLDVGLGDDVVVVGGGPIGLLNMLVARLSGARVIVSDLDPARREFASKIGAHAVVDASDGKAPDQVREITGGRGADAVIVAIGNHRANLDALDMVAEFGQVLLFASAYPPTELPVDPNVVHQRQISVVGARHPSVPGFEIAVDLLSKRLIEVEDLIEERVPFDDIGRALETAIRPETYRIIVTL